MQSIQTKYLPATNTKGSRIKASCERGSVTIPYPYECNCEEAHVLAAKTLVHKFLEEDKAKYNQAYTDNTWGREFVTGCLPDSTFAHVFI